MKPKSLLIFELIFLFAGIPVFLVLDLSPYIKAGAVMLGIVYVLWIVLKNKLISAKSLYQFPLSLYWKQLLIRYLGLMVMTVLYTYFFHSEDLFIVVKKNFGMWVGITFFYSVFSVYPQEFLYRTFFFERYGILFKNAAVLVCVNAVLFSLAHIGFKNPLVLVITLVGGILFAITYQKTKSLMLTSVEHALYGSWLFTVGMGEMLAFPMPA